MTGLSLGGDLFLGSELAVHSGDFLRRFSATC
jgi:hypothetical protein